MSTASSFRLCWTLLACMAGCPAAPPDPGGSAADDDAGDSDGDEGSDSAEEDCPDVAGVWEISEHCVSDFVGEEINVVQDGCSLEIDSIFEGFVIGVSASGAVSVSGTIDGEAIVCMGTATQDRIVLNCEDPDGDCAVAVDRQ